jgi:hypothetical protein
MGFIVQVSLIAFHSLIDQLASTASASQCLGCDRRRPVQIATA